MEKMIHMAAQYLATAAIRFLPAKDDDSHTNLGLNVKEGYLYSRSFGEQSYFLSLSYTDFSLNFHGPNDISKLLLHGKSHKEIISWITQTCGQVISSIEYKFSLHYELPYAFDDDFVFEIDEPDEVTELLKLRRLAHAVFTNFLKENHFESEIRIWPHHFDTGIFFSFNKDNDKQLGMGLAIPDDMLNAHYFYVSGYDQNGVIDTNDFGPLEQGKWIQNGFKGAVLEASGSDPLTFVNFLNEVKEEYIS